MGRSCDEMIFCFYLVSTGRCCSEETTELRWMLFICSTVVSDICFYVGLIVATVITPWLPATPLFVALSKLTSPSPLASPLSFEVISIGAPPLVPCLSWCYCSCCCCFPNLLLGAGMPGEFVVEPDTCTTKPPGC